MARAAHVHHMCRSHVAREPRRHSRVTRASRHASRVHHVPTRIRRRPIVVSVLKNIIGKSVVFVIVGSVSKNANINTKKNFPSSSDENRNIRFRKTTPTVSKNRREKHARLKRVSYVYVHARKCAHIYMYIHRYTENLSTNMFRKTKQCFEELKTDSFDYSIKLREYP